MDFEQILKGIGSPFRSAGGNGQPATDQFARYGSMLLQHAPRWAMVAATGMKCALHYRARGREVGCGRSAIGPCVVCQMPTCVDHSMVSIRDGNLICFACVGKASQAQTTTGAAYAPPPEPPEESGPRAADPGQGPPGWWGAPPPPAAEAEDDRELRGQHISTLGLDGDPSLQVIKTAYRRMAAQNHPDRFQTERGKQNAERRMRQINEAYTWLSRNQRAA